MALFGQSEMYVIILIVQNLSKLKLILRNFVRIKKDASMKKKSSQTTRINVDERVGADLNVLRNKL